MLLNFSQHTILSRPFLRVLVVTLFPPEVLDDSCIEQQGTIITKALLDNLALFTTLREVRIWTYVQEDDYDLALFLASLPGLHTLQISF